MGVPKTTLSIKPWEIAGKTQGSHTLDYLEQKNKIVQLKSQSKGKNHNLPTFTDVGFLDAIWVSLLGENPLDTIFLEVFKFACHSIVFGCQIGEQCSNWLRTRVRYNTLRLLTSLTKLQVLFKRPNCWFALDRRDSHWTSKLKLVLIRTPKSFSISA